LLGVKKYIYLADMRLLLNLAKEMEMEMEQQHMRISAMLTARISLFASRNPLFDLKLQLEVRVGETEKNEKTEEKATGRPKTRHASRAKSK